MSDIVEIVLSFMNIRKSIAEVKYIKKVLDLKWKIII